MDFDDLNEFLGKIDNAKLDGVGDDGEEEVVEYDPVEGFDFQNADPLSDQMLEFHHPQLNWLLRVRNEYSFLSYGSAALLARKLASDRIVAGSKFTSVTICEMPYCRQTIA